MVAKAQVTYSIPPLARTDRRRSLRRWVRVSIVALPRGNAMHDLVIRGGTVVDGTGSPARTADVTVDGGHITGVGSFAGDSANRTVDADGLLVTPGWVDIHTHYDGQATWDEVLAPSSWHGVTTIVTGNCGVGFAPARPDRHEWLIGLMEGVEDIPGTALAEGMHWEWETFPEYLDTLERRKWTVDVGTQIAHGAVRSYVMGERGARNEPATAGGHRGHEAAGQGGRSPPGPSASRRRGPSPTWPSTASRCRAPSPPRTSCSASAAPSANSDRGSSSWPRSGVAGEDIIGPKKEIDWMRRLSAAIRRPVTFALVQVDDAPDLWRELMDESLRAVSEGADLWPQVAGRGFGLLVRPLHHLLACSTRSPPTSELKAKGLSPDESLSPPCAIREVRRSIESWEPDPDTADRMDQAFRTTFTLGSPPEYEPGPERSLTGIAAATGRTPLSVAYDAMLEDDGRGLLYVPILNYSDGDLEPGPRDAAPSTGRRRARRRRGALRGHLRRRRNPPSCSPTGRATGPGAIASRSSGW